MIVYSLKKRKKYLTNRYLTGIKDFIFTNNISLANKWQHIGWAKNRAKMLRDKGQKVKVVAIEIKEVPQLKKIKKSFNNLIL